MKEIDCTQGELSWLQARLGKVTASEADALLTLEFEPKKGETPKTFLYKKLAEMWTKRPVDEFTAFATEQGQMLEYDARRWYAFTHEEQKVRQVGFIEHDNGRCGCSPDGLINDDGGLELKCPQPTNHMRYFQEGKLPKDYVVQVHFSLYVTGRPWWAFVSYSRKPPVFEIIVQRDEAICAKIHEALAGFYERFDAAMAKLKAT